MAALRPQAGRAVALLKPMANADRLLLLCHLLEAPATVAELGAATGLAQPSLSQQLAVLRREGLVSTQRQGKAIEYRLASPAVAALLKTLYRLFCTPTPTPTQKLKPAAKPTRTSQGASRP